MGTDSKIESLKLTNVLWHFIMLRRRRYFTIMVTGTACAFVLSIGNQFETILIAKEFFSNLTERLIDFSIFLPSMTFVCLSLLPSVSRKIKIILGQSTDGRVIGYSLLMNLVYVMYLAVFTLIHSIIISTLIKLPDSTLEYVYYCACWKPLTIAITSSLFILPAILISELFMTVFILHSMLRRELEEFNEDYGQFFNRVKENQISVDQYQDAIKTRIQENLTASSVELLEKLKKKKSEG